MKLRTVLGNLGDALAPERVYRRKLWYERNRYWDALAEIRTADPVDMALDPTWAQRIAAEALAPSGGPR